MLFMNEWEIRDNEDRYRLHPTLGPATRFLRQYMEEVNRVSDGWPYWSAPVHAAKQLMTVIQKREATIDEVRKAITPIKSFMTRRGLKAGMALPSIQLVLKEQR